MKKIDRFPGMLGRSVVSREYVTRTGRTGVQHTQKIVLTPEQEAWLRRWFPETENGVLAQAAGMSPSSLSRLARDFGLKKSEAGMHAIMKRQGKKAKKSNERNGLYERLRANGPSEATKAGTAKMWEDIRAGRRLHPMHVLKARHPRRYRKMIEQRSATRRELIRKEKWRVYYGLRQQSALPFIRVNNYTKSQSNHRYNAQRRGYFVMEDCSEASGERYNIYYDQDTQRSERFERNLRADGFTLIEYIEYDPHND